MRCSKEPQIKYHLVPAVISQEMYKSKNQVCQCYMRKETCCFAPEDKHKAQ